MTISAPFRIGAVGDISFEGSLSENPSLEIFANIVHLFQQVELQVANLECVLNRGGNSGIPGKCTLRGNPDWAKVLKEAGLGLVSLANNHVMDFGAQGLLETIDALQKSGIHFVGAGYDRRKACSPIFLDIAGHRVAFLGRSSVIVGAPIYATDLDPGIAFLDAEETVGMVRTCHSQADLVVLMVHWGIEEYSYPSPAQRLLARQFMAAGADLIIGHHPHVLQGYERIGSSVVAYSLGNFVFNEFEWDYRYSDGNVSKQFSPMSRENRAGVVAMFKWTGCGAPQVEPIFTRIEHGGKIAIDLASARHSEWEALCTGLRRWYYGIGWRWYAVNREWTIRLKDQASLSKVLSNIHRIRPRHFIAAIRSIRRSLRIVYEKTTNPYE